MAAERKLVPSDLNTLSMREKPPLVNKTPIGKAELAPTDPPRDQPNPDQADNVDWRADLLSYLLREVLPDDQNAARQIARRAKTFAVIDSKLYKCSPSKTGVLMKCISIAQGRELLLEIHSGICRHHAAPRSLVRKAFRQGFYWSTTLRNAEEIVRACKGCQFYAKQTHLPAQALQTIHHVAIRGVRSGYGQTTAEGAGRIH
ncbi:uncharacterized protein LOC120701990 [Panicum virgatum]|uniref:uncharacterized protein LOC120701990 n=1 Tax=Panicum virgatum TaxID=38727 RepID=UPI0019D502C1|nr:uncharacterized protein LOC120701990 [Panicum virgatum]